MPHLAFGRFALQIASFPVHLLRHFRHCRWHPLEYNRTWQWKSIRPFDWVMLAVEVLVLALIAYEVWVGFHERRIKRLRERFLAG